MGNANTRLVSFDVLSFAVNKAEKKINDEGYKLTLNFDIRVDVAKKFVIIIMTVDVFSSENMDENQLVGQVSTSTIFEIENFDGLVENGRVKEIPENLMQTLSGIALSTTRGAVCALFKGTYLESVLIPIADAKNLSPKKKVKRNKS